MKVEVEVGKNLKSSNVLKIRQARSSPAFSRANDEVKLTYQLESSLVRFAADFQRICLFPAWNLRLPNKGYAFT